MSITVTEFKNNLSKYIALASKEDTTLLNTDILSRNSLPLFKIKSVQHNLYLEVFPTL